MKLTVYGTGTSGHQVVTSTLKKFLKLAQIECDIHEVTDVDQFLKKKINSVPAVQIDGEVPHSISVDKSFNKSLRGLVKDVLRRTNYGAIPKVIIPIDFSDASTNAFYFGQRIASQTKAITKVLHVYKPSPADLQGSVKDKEQRRLERFVGEIDQDWNSDIMQTALVESEFRTGFPADEILKSSVENTPSFIVMGTLGNSGILKLLFGSVSTKVLSEARCPVLLIPEKAGYKGINHIMYASENMETDINCLDQVVRFARPFEAKIHMIRVANNDHERISEEQIKNIKRKYPFSRFSFETINAKNIIDTLSKYARIHRVDMQVFCHQKRNILSEFLHKSKTVEMSIYTEVPILIVHPTIREAE